MVGRVVRESAEFGLRSVAPAELHTFQHALLIVIVTVARVLPDSGQFPPVATDSVGSRVGGVSAQAVLVGVVAQCCVRGCAERLISAMSSRFIARAASRVSFDSRRALWSWSILWRSRRFSACSSKVCCSSWSSSDGLALPEAVSAWAPS